MNITIIGLGLIGGSIALECKKHFPKSEVLGIDKHQKHLDQALKDKLIDKATSLENLKKTDLVFLAIPVDASFQILPQILDKINDKTLVIELGSTKQRICESVKNHKRRHQFIATHPIAGTEFSGPTAAIYNLFQEKICILCDCELTETKRLEMAKDILKKFGMKLDYMDAVSHDIHIAYVSHLSHITSFMLGKTVIEKEKDEKQIFNMAGSGFESTVRLAKSAPSTWTPIFKENKSNVLKSLKEYIRNLQHFQNLLENNDYNSIFEELKNTNRIKTILKEIN